MRHLWTALDASASRHACTGCGIRAERRERESRKARTPGQMVSVPVYVLPGGAETERLPDCDRKLLIPKTPAARPTPVEELAELRVRFAQVQRTNEELFAADRRVREILGADISESTEAAAERLATLAEGLSERAARALAGGPR